MEGCDGTLDGRPDELTLRRFIRFGAGGAKLIWGEATAVSEDGRANPRQLHLNEKTAPDFQRMLEVCRQAHRQASARMTTWFVGTSIDSFRRYSHRRR